MKRKAYVVVPTQDQLDKQARLEGRVRVVPVGMRTPARDMTWEYYNHRLDDSVYLNEKDQARSYGRRAVYERDYHNAEVED
jgi:hypothetical protein